MTDRRGGAPAPTGSTAYRQDDERQRTEARMLSLHTMVEELRQALRELASRQLRLDEGMTELEGMNAQNRLAVEALRQDMQQSGQARILDENRTRSIIADFDTRIEDITRPIRALQSQVHELGEAGRRKGDDTTFITKRFEEVRVQIEDVRSVADRSVAMGHQLRESIEAANDQGDELRRELMRTDDLIKMLDQDMRRRVQEVGEGTDEYASRIDELRSDLAHSYEIIEQVRRAIVPFEPAIEELREKDAALRQDITRYAAQSAERVEAIIERQDAIVADLDSRFGDIRQSYDQRLERVNERIEEMEELQRQLTFRFSSLVNEIEGLRQVDDGLQRELWVLHEQRVRLRMEQVQQELDYLTRLRREHGQEPAPEKPRQRRPDF